MLQGLIQGRRRQQSVVRTVKSELSVVLEMPGKSEGETIPHGKVVSELLWQHYGLDLLHPEVSRWLESHAPDVKYAIAESRLAKQKDRNRAGLRVGPRGEVKVHLSPEVDQRLRDVSSGYLRKIAHLAGNRNSAVLC